MMNRLKLAFLIHSLLWEAHAFANGWVWNGCEIMGNRSIAREEIIKLIPLKIGEKYKEDVASWKQWCGEIAKAFSLASAECSGVRYSDFKAYFVVDVVERGQEYRNQFREAPAKDVALASTVVMETYQKLQKRLWDLFSQGKPPSESWDKGYLDYSDSEMHRLVLDLVKDTPSYWKNIIRVLSKDRDPEKRMAAADLLNWAGKGPHSVLRTHKLLDDPHSGVRNQLSRFMMHFVGRIHDDTEVKNVIDSLLLQLDRPSFGDRNKALFNLLEILSSKPQLGSYVKSKGLALIQYIADNSILSNVAGPAKDLITKLEGSR